MLKKSNPCLRSFEKDGSYTEVPVERMTRVTSEVGAQYVGLNLPKPWQEIAKGPVLSCITKHPRTPPPTAFVTRENSKIIFFGTPLFRRTHCCSELGLFEAARYFNLFLFYFRMPSHNLEILLFNF